MGDIGKGLEIVFYLLVYFFLMFVASIFIAGVALILGWSPWLLLAYPFMTAIYVGLRLTILSSI